MQAASKVTKTPALLAQPACEIQDWFNAYVPGTVLGALVQNGVFPDPFRDNNLENIPESMFVEPWWFRTEFHWSPDDSCALTSLDFDGLNYRAEIWLNGKQITRDQKCFGAFRRWRFDVSDVLAAGKNALAIRVAPPQNGDFSIGFVDWNPPAPDRNMGLFRSVSLHRHGLVALRHPFVQSRFNEDFSTADLHVTATLENLSSEEVSCQVKVKFGRKELEKNSALKPHQCLDINLTSEEFAELHIENPELWWPNNLGAPTLHELTITVVLDGTSSDAETVTFGLRKIDSWLNTEGNREFAINGKEILIKGAGWTD
ncbi:MAG: glycoside hydrolase family 2, partial [Calditrichaeota bacterium]